MNRKNKSAERLIYGSAANQKQRAHYYDYSRQSQGRFIRSNMPAPIDVLHQLGFQIVKTNIKGIYNCAALFTKMAMRELPV